MTESKTTSKNDFLSKPINISDTGTTEICINNDTWPDKKKLDNNILLISLVVKDAGNTLPTERYYDSKLMLKVTAFSKSHNHYINRLTSMDYVNSDSIILNKASPNNGSSKLEMYNRGYKLGLIANFHFREFSSDDERDDITIRLNILKGDSILNKASPRLLIQDYKSVFASHGFGYAISSFVLDFTLVICAIVLLILFLTFIKFDKQ